MGKKDLAETHQNWSKYAQIWWDLHKIWLDLDRSTKMTKESLIPVEKCKILVYRYVESIKIGFSWEDLPTDLQVSIARGKDPPLIVTGIE